MKFPGSPSRVLFPALISITDESAALLNEMAHDMGISLDELLSGIAEDSVSGLGQLNLSSNEIPNSVSTQELKDLLDK
tara:strand:- start:741 stop:974 length:234 start_codon:yes stop_codon:yes gene_type:complete